jgi:deoxyhypusine synthase
MSITNFIDLHYRHFNAAALKDAAQSYKAHVDSGGKMLVTLAGAMSTAELGISLAEMIRNDKVHAISCTGANLEEDLFHMVAANHYKRLPDYRYLTKEDDHQLWLEHNNRVTDTCIPEAEAMRVLESVLVDSWKKAQTNGTRMFPHEHFYEIIRSGVLNDKFQKDPKTSWLIAACEKNLPIFVPGDEDSTTGNMFAGRIFLKELEATSMKSGMEYMSYAMEWYLEESKKNSRWGIFQIGGGIAGDFILCLVPTMNQDFRGLLPPMPLWSYFCQISDSTTSYGSFSGATPNEKITWGKLQKDTPMFVVESDATICAPLMFAYVMGW